MIILLERERDKAREETRRGVSDITGEKVKITRACLHNPNIVDTLLKTSYLLRINNNIHIPTYRQTECVNKDRNI